MSDDVIQAAREAVAQAAIDLAEQIPGAEDAGPLPGKAEAVKTLGEAVAAVYWGPQGGRGQTEYHYHTHPHEVARANERATGFGDGQS